MVNKSTWGIILLTLAIIMFSASVIAESDCIYYFYGKDCDDCQDVSQHISALSEKYSDLNIKKTEVYYNEDNQKQLNQFYTAYGIDQKDQGVPVIFTSEAYFIGKKPILELLEKHLLENNNTICPNTKNVTAAGFVGKSEANTILGSLTFFTITSAAVKFFTAPGTVSIIAVLLLLIVLSITLESSRKIIYYRTMFFILGAIVTYFIFGLGYFSWFSSERITTYAPKIIGIITIIISSILVIRLAAVKKELFEHMSNQSRKDMHYTRDMILNPLGSLILGIVVGLFSLSGLPKAFMWVRHLISIGDSVFVAVIMLLYFLLLWVLLPLVVNWIIHLLRWQGEEFKDRKSWIWKRKELKALNVVLAAACLVVGIILIII